MFYHADFQINCSLFPAPLMEGKDTRRAFSDQNCYLIPCETIQESMPRISDGPSQAVGSSAL